ncbi:DUF2357 domain-containing protein [Sphingobacterium cellulitidis]|uniref:DUF2357 domain-containing protein n=1 Tax=Sphingobacterium cellulitidis TaxID=1768011 RepID=UPI003C799E9E
MQKRNQEILHFNLNEVDDGLTLVIFPEQQSHLRTIDQTTAEEFNESSNQLFEGHTYEYEFDGTNKENFRLEAIIKGVVLPSNRYHYRGRISPNIFVGKLQLLIINIQKRTEFPLFLEIIATKFNKKEDLSYRVNYRKMLEDITDKCTDLMMQINTPVSQTIAIDYTTDNKTMYQRFCFVKSFLDTKEFEEAILRIISNPSTLWKNNETSIKSSQIRRVNRSVTKNLITATNRIDCNDLTYLTKVGLTSIPSRIQSTTRIESIDTQENRFIKHVLGVFLNFVENCQSIFKVNNGFDYAFKESSLLFEKISRYLSFAFFNEVSVATTLKLNSPLLQKRSGYREVLNRWLQFDLASKLIWHGGEDVYEAGKKDIATLYEYWLFFQLYELIIQKFNLQAYQNQNFEHLFETDELGLSLKLKSGKELIIKGETNFESRNLTIRFSYNRTFKGGVKYHSEEAGSITTTLRPDYTLSIWPSSFTEVEAEKEEVITHIHFDAKYKIQNLRDQYTESDDEEVLNRIDERERKGTFKNIDVLKMHAYKDAIRRTGGAYILYPGKNEEYFKGFHEVLPGLGAFSISPSLYDTGINSLSQFLDEVILHLVDRTTQRERISNVSNQILKEPQLAYGKSLKSIPKHLEREKINLLQTYVLVGYAKTQKHIDWYESKGIYNFRMNDNVGSLEFTAQVVQAKYLLLRESGKDVASKLYKITSNGPKVYSKGKLIQLGYDNPSQPDYLVVSIEPCKDWSDLEVNYKEFEEYKSIKASISSKPAIPFVVTLDRILKRNL